ncbi:MAG: hypothetical protein H7Z11_03515 [Verrucomicrobia bacterium]|nr:hypothetical protein [Leptolyngbya sp. ES-bin-22]
MLFIAASLDGCIARASDAVDWLITDQDYGYTEVLANVDTVLMGQKNYEQVLSFGKATLTNSLGLAKHQSYDSGLVQLTDRFETSMRLRRPVSKFDTIQCSAVWIGGAIAQTLTIIQLGFSLLKVRGIVEIPDNFFFQTVNEIRFQTVGVSEGSQIAIHIEAQVVKAITSIPEFNNSVAEPLVIADGGSVLQHIWR